MIDTIHELLEKWKTLYGSNNVGRNHQQKVRLAQADNLIIQSVVAATMHICCNIS